MLNDQMESYLIGNLIDGISSDLSSVFPRLESDAIDYRDSGFRSRRRCFSSYAVYETGVRLDDDIKPLFNQSKEFHKVAEEKPIPTLESAKCDAAVVETFLNQLLPYLPIPNIENYAIGVNLIRVLANDENMGSPAPGLHQDGYDFSCHMNVSRENVCGGTSLIATDQDSESIVVEHPLQPGEFVFFNDRTMYHTATPVVPRIAGKECHRDMIIVDIVKNTFKR